MKISLFLFLLAGISLAAQAANFVRLEGGADGGGGNAHWESVVSPQELREVLLNAKFYLLPVLNYHEEMAKNQDPADSRHLGGISFEHLRRSQERLFLGRENVFSALSEIKIRVEENGPCADLKNDHKDASAFSATPNEICISAQRLAGKLTARNVVIEVTALLGHELVHRMGGGEEEANAFQDFIRLSSILGEPLLFRAQPEANGPAQLGAIWDKYARAASLAKAGFWRDQVALCLALEDLSASIRKASEGNMRFGITSFRYGTSRAIYVADLQARQLLNYCLRQPADPDFVWLNILSKLPAEKIPAQSLLSGGSWRGHDMGFIQRIPYRNQAALRFNLEQLEMNLEGIRKAVKIP